MRSGHVSLLGARTSNETIQASLAKHVHVKLERRQWRARRLRGETVSAEFCLPHAESNCAFVRKTTSHITFPFLHLRINEICYRYTRYTP